MNVVEVSKLRKTYLRGFWRTRTPVLHGIDFAVERGEVFGFLGPNGAGKTTTIKILMGLVFPTSGSARVLGMPAGAREAKQRVGYLPENPYFYDYLTVLELLDMVARLHGVAARERKRRADELVARVGLAQAADRPLRSYSKGMLQRAGLAQALIGRPELVVLDEPMSGLDPLGRKEVRDLILELKENGTTVFFSTHILSDATMLCDRVGIIVRGHLRDVGPLGELLSPAVHGVEVVWNAAPEVAESLRLLEGDHTETSEGHVFRTPDPEYARTFVGSVVGAGGEVLQLQRHRQSLEALFVAEAEREQADRGAEAEREAAESGRGAAERRTEAEREEAEREAASDRGEELR